MIDMRYESDGQFNWPYKGSLEQTTKVMEGGSSTRREEETSGE